ncbi:MAG: peroxiredoxin [Deinococcales bacterium]
MKASVGQKLQAGDEAPDFQLHSTEGIKALADFKGEWLVLYVYPKDDTPGCTQESCDFRDSQLNQSLAAQVLGLSGDDLASHQGFANKYRLPFPLLSDPELKVIKAYGAYGEKNFYGKLTEGILRSSFIITPQGKIAEAMYNIKVAGHVERIIKRLEELKQA